MVPISAAPAPRSRIARVPGHWEGDLIMGAGGRSAVATLVERQTRYVLLARLGHDRRTRHVIEALKQRIKTLPAHLVRSLTWDQGTRARRPQALHDHTGIEVYFCDPHSPVAARQQREHQRAAAPVPAQRHDLAVHDQTELDQIAAELNGRPRKTLGWMNPAEKMTELLASTPHKPQPVHSRHRTPIKDATAPPASQKARTETAR